MVTLPIHRPVTLSLTPSLGVAAAACAATICLILPSATLEALVLNSGIPAILPAAEPPLGYTARVALAMITGGAAGAIVWLAAFLAFGGEGAVTLKPRTPRAKPVSTVESTAPAPVLRRADAHPDAPARAPLNAAQELGAWFQEPPAASKPVAPPVERALPKDLDAPLAAFDPAAIPAVPAEPQPVVGSLQPLPIKSDLEPGERIDAFELPRPAVQTDAAPIAAPRTDATIHALLDRLERGVAARRQADPAKPSVAGTLDELRKLATR
ncbi:hypothetical protein [uncultured Sphingomonas sp.]|uniref:hypothetical protein n=1 Tax=uncultured Sphingomonas sp. TaxID=158754 RepID=UPI0025F49FBA|nr:hypothetical protein [uncultured Sphingomonas sp.]